MGVADSREYDRLKARKFRPYSAGHRRMYEEAIKRIASPSRIFEAGFGIGWGLDRMVEAGVISQYNGCEPNNDSFKYTDDRHGARPNVHLDNVGFPDILHLRDGRDTLTFDHVFCIEVIEHVPMDDHLEFLQALRSLGGKLWFSTPDIRKAPTEGVRTKEDWVRLLKAAGFNRVEVDTKSWTYLYACS